MSRTRLEWAQWMASKGITAFIVDANSKRPLGGTSWYVRNTTEPEQLAEWFETTPDCNYGLWLGKEHVVIDLDVKHDTAGISGIEAFELICAENGISNFLFELDTLTVKTPSGGYHLYFRTPEPCANKNTFPDLIDVRGAVGYVVGPGSQVKAGEWEVVDEDATIRDIPDFILGYLVTPGIKDPNHSVPLIELDQETNIEQATTYLKGVLPAIEGKNGDEHTYEVCCYLRDFGISEAMALTLFHESGWNARCEPPWDLGHLEVKITNSYAFGQNRPGCKAETYKVQRLQAGRPAGGWAAVLTDEKVAEMFTPRDLRVVGGTDVDGDGDPDIPQDVGDSDDPMDEFRANEQLWYGIQDFAAIDKVREYIVKGWLIAHGITALLAVRGTGKSTIALDLGMHLAKDMDWWGLSTMPNWKVIYICGEDDEGMILNVRAWAEYDDRGLPANDRFLVAKDIIKMTNKTLLRVRLKEMKEWAAGARCLVILDTWARATSGYSSNTQEEMDTAYENAEMVAAALSGPMIACFHPPKDGRMTIRGSAVQEDASSGIWELVEDASGLRLTIARAKGKGRGNFRLFKKEVIALDGEDYFEEKLQGIVFVHHGGTEEGGDAGVYANKVTHRNAWGKAIIGALEVWPSQDHEEVKNDVTNLSKFLTTMWTTRDEDTEAGLFCAEWMDEIEKYGLMDTVVPGDDNQKVRRVIDDHFLKSTESRTVIFDKYKLSVELKPNTKLKHFVIGEAKEGTQE